MLLSIGRASVLIGVSSSTLRRWEREGKIVSSCRTSGGHRRYDLHHLKSALGSHESRRDDRIRLGYGRVSSSDQRSDLERQKNRLEQWLKDRGSHNIEIISDLGSGLNMRKRGLNKLLKLLLQGKLKELVICHKDRLLRFGNEIIFLLCEHFGVKVSVIEEKEPATGQEQLTRDLITIITVFSSKLYGQRSHEKRKARKKDSEKKAS